MSTTPNNPDSTHRKIGPQAGAQLPGRGFAVENPPVPRRKVTRPRAEAQQESGQGLDPWSSVSRMRASPSVFKDGQKYAPGSGAGER